MFSEVQAFTESQHRKEVNRLTDSLAKCNGIIKPHTYKLVEDIEPCQ